MDLSFLTDSVLINTLLFLLIFIVVFQALRRVLFKDNKPISAIISLVVATLAVWYISQSQMDFLGKAYSTIGATILIALPAIIIFFFIYTAEIKSVGRRLVWIFYSIISIYIFSGYSPFIEETNVKIILGIIFVTIIVLFLDNTIKEYFIGKKINKQ